MGAGAAPLAALAWFKSAVVPPEHFFQQSTKARKFPRPGSFRALYLPGPRAGLRLGGVGVAVQVLVLAACACTEYLGEFRLGIAVVYGLVQLDRAKVTCLNTSTH